MLSLALRGSRLSTAAFRFGVLGCIALLAATSAAHAARHYPKAIKDALANGATVVKTFPAASGLTGWVLSENGTYSVAYTTADRRTLIIGNLFNEKGENLTDLYSQKHFPKPDRSSAFNQLNTAAYVTEGAAKEPKSILYIFADTNSPNCQTLWKALQPHIRTGLQVRWIPVALEPGSMSKAVEILQAADITVAFRAEGVEARKFRSFAQTVTKATDQEAVRKINRNHALMAAFGINSVPGIVWKDRAGKVQVKSTMPQPSELPGITELQSNQPAATR